MPKTDDTEQLAAHVARYLQTLQGFAEVAQADLEDAYNSGDGARIQSGSITVGLLAAVGALGASLLPVLDPKFTRQVEEDIRNQVDALKPTPHSPQAPSYFEQLRGLRAIRDLGPLDAQLAHYLAWRGFIVPHHVAHGGWYLTDAGVRFLTDAPEEVRRG